MSRLRTFGMGLLLAVWAFPSCAYDLNIEDPVSGPPAEVSAVSAIEQTAAAGGEVPSPPSVRVTDASGEPVAGATVAFRVEAGNGGIMGADVTTDSHGYAGVDSWTLSTTPRLNQMTAAVASLPVVRFFATGVPPCTYSAHLLDADFLSGWISNADCFSGGVPGDSINFTIPVQQARQFTLNPAALNVALDISQVASQSLAIPGQAETLRVIFAPGSYRGVIKPVNAAGRGYYSVTTAPITSDQTGCGPFFATAGIVTPQAITADDCPVQAAPGARFDEFRVLMEVGRTYTVSTTSPAAKTIEIWTAQGLAAHNRGAPGTAVGITPTIRLFHSIHVIAADAGALGPYALTIQ